MRTGWDDGGRVPALAGAGFEGALARRMPHLCLAVAALVAAAWWTFAHVPLQQRPPYPPPPPPPQQPQPAAGSACGSCDVCVDCDLSGCDLSGCDCACDLADACSGCDLGGCDCVAVPPGTAGPAFDLPTTPAPPRGARPAPWRSWASLGLLLPLAVMFVWRRRR